MGLQLARLCAVAVGRQSIGTFDGRRGLRHRRDAQRRRRRGGSRRARRRKEDQVPRLAAPPVAAAIPGSWAWRRRLGPCRATASGGIPFCGRRNERCRRMREGSVGQSIRRACSARALPNPSFELPVSGFEVFRGSGTGRWSGACGPGDAMTRNIRRRCRLRRRSSRD